jgi:hypothetical protein
VWLVAHARSNTPRRDRSDDLYADCPAPGFVRTDGAAFLMQRSAQHAVRTFSGPVHRCVHRFAYSATSSAWASSIGGTARLSTRAVLRFFWAAAHRQFSRRLIP